MTDEELRSVALELRDYMLRQFPTEDADYEFSPRILKKKKRLIELEKHAARYYFRRFAAIFFVTLLISGGIVFGFNKEVRADAIKWFRDHFTENGYKYQKDIETPIVISQYSLKDIIPEGYQCVDRIEENDILNELYIGENGEMLVFTVMSSSKKEEINVSSDQKGNREILEVNGVKADLYLSENDNESNIIVWEGKNGALFSIQGILNKDQLLKIADKIE